MTNSDRKANHAPTLPDHVAGFGTIDTPVGPAPTCARSVTTENTNRAYAADWKHFSRWCRLNGAEPLPPSPDLLGRYIADLAAPTEGTTALTVSTIERRLSGIAWNVTQRGFALDRSDRHIATVLSRIRREQNRPPARKEAITPEGFLDMVAVLDFDLRGLRDRAILLIGYAGGLRRSEIVSLDRNKDDTPDSGGWVEIDDQRALLFLNGKTGWREVEIGRQTSTQTCPVHALEAWLTFAKIDLGPIFVRTNRSGTKPLSSRLNDRYLARLVKRCVLAAGLRKDLPEKERLALYSWRSLRAGPAWPNAARD